MQKLIIQNINSFHQRMRLGNFFSGPNELNFGNLFLCLTMRNEAEFKKKSKMTFNWVENFSSARPFVSFGSTKRSVLTESMEVMPKEKL